VTDDGVIESAVSADTWQREQTMSTRMSGTGNLIRLLVGATFIALLAVTTVHPTEANQSGPPVGSRVALQTALCKLGGGDTSEDHFAGQPDITVTCRGGLLDGMECYNTLRASACVWAWRLVPTQDPTAVPAVGIEPLDMADAPPATDDPTTDTGEVVGEPEVALSDEPTATPEPTIDDGGPVVDQPVVDGGDSAPEPTATPGDDVSQGPVVDDPVVSDGGDVAPEPTRDPIVIEPQIDVEIIAPIEEITLT
jgi:hypothetical protein